MADPSGVGVVLSAPTLPASPASAGSAVAEERRALRRQWERTAASVGDLWGAPSTGYYRRREMELIASTLGPLAGKRVLKLDLWNEAFNTRIGHWMEEQGAHLVAFDHSSTVAARARRQSRGARRMLCADIRDIPFADRSFDCVYTMGTIEHIREYRHTLREIRRVLRVGGKAVVGVPFRWDPFLRPAVVTLLEWMGKYPYAPEKSFGPTELRRDLEGAGLRVLARTGILALPGQLRLLDVWCHTRGVPLAPLWRALIAPFEYLETRSRAARNLGYLMAMVVERPAPG